MALLSHEFQLLNAPFPLGGSHAVTQEQLEASGASAWGSPLEGLQGGFSEGLSTPQLHQQLIFCSTLRGKHKTPDFIYKITIIPFTSFTRV